MYTHDSVDTSHLLADHKHDRDNRSLPVRGNEPHLLEESLSRRITDKESLVLELSRHIRDLTLDILMASRKP